MKDQLVHRMGVRLTEHERMQIEKLSKSSGMTMSQTVRHLLATSLAHAKDEKAPFVGPVPSGAVRPLAQL